MVQNMKTKADHSKSSQAVYQWAPRLCRPGSDGSHWIAIISILVAVVMFYRWSGLDARSRNELAENMEDKRDGSACPMMK